MAPSCGHGAAAPAYTLAELAVAFRDARRFTRAGRAPALVIRCGWCQQRSKRVVEEAARYWYVAHECAQPFSAEHRESIHAASAHPFSEPGLSPEFRLTLAQAAARLEEVERRMVPGQDIYRGGVRLGLEPPTPEEIAYRQRVDEILTRLLGGIPQPRAPRRLPAEVVNLDEWRQQRALAA